MTYAKCVYSTCDKFNGSIATWFTIDQIGNKLMGPYRTSVRIFLSFL